MTLRYISIITVALLTGCSVPVEKSVAGWEDWKKRRIENLKAEHGFLNLAGLYWLKEGPNFFGSGEANELVFPVELPANLGVLTLDSGEVWLETEEPGVIVNGQHQERALVRTKDGEYKEMAYKGYRWYVIERAGNIGIRLKDLNHPKLSEEIDIDYYPFDPKWMFRAKFRRYKEPKKLRIENVHGHVYQMDIEGQLTFEINGEEYSLEPITEGDKFFIMFADATSAVETYGSGRYMYAPFPDHLETVFLDFNRAYNPPCAFTDFATCLLPPPENQLDVAIKAGELDYNHK